MGDKGLDETVKHHTCIVNPKNEEDPAIVFLDEDMIESSTEKQIQAMLLNPSISRARVMPDCHVGHGCCVGFTARVSPTRIAPAYVGGDIGCGVLTYPLSRRRLNLVKVEKTIKHLIPMGNGHHNVHSQPPVVDAFVERYLQRAQSDAFKFAEMMEIHIDSSPFFTMEYLHNLCNKIGMNYDDCIRSFGTLGGGNHFIEIGEDETSEELYLTIHSGSRSFGMKLFEYHNRLIDQTLKCLVDETAVAYCFDMILAQHVAVMNRHIMLQLILRELGFDYDESRIIESSHNYIDFAKMILRKGAIAAEEGQRCLVALNMRDGMLLCTGKGNSDWNYSCAHGCGRIMSRSEARRRIKLRDYQKAMAAVVSSSVCSATLDEAPQAYKDMNVIMEALGPTVHIEKRIKTVLNLKGVD